MSAIRRATQQQHDTAIPEHCVTRSRIYSDIHEYCRDVTRRRKHGWRVISVRLQRVPVSVEQIRAGCPGALVRCRSEELVAYYMRCGPAQQSRLLAWRLSRKH